MTLKSTVFAFVLGFAATPALAACSQDHIALRGDWGQVGFRIEIADTFDSRAQGLMFRESMARFDGMLFVYGRPQKVRFWMKNTLIPLDMIFIDPTGMVTRIHEMATPGSLKGIPGGAGVQYVLEVNGGLARQLGLDVGTQVQHPAIKAQKAVWPCE